MFGFFKKKQSNSSDASKLALAITNTLNAQLILCRSSDKINDDWAIGYIGGFADGVLQFKGVGTDETGSAVMLIVFGSIFGDKKRVEYFKRYISLKESENVAAMEGDKIGGNEAFSLIGGNSKRALGLTTYCHNLEQLL